MFTSYFDEPVGMSMNIVYVNIPIRPEVEVMSVQSMTMILLSSSTF